MKLKNNKFKFKPIKFFTTAILVLLGLVFLELVYLGFFYKPADPEEKEAPTSNKEFLDTLDKFNY
ncbi:hypothetical protein AUK11_00195 [bacterium CG2_30_37_16]|nr:MAG: hypothetical protein AUK11_00195 [bacterium CG2_30_37_16]PIP30641.1 MAG: hypothetical protein COX25_03560 [bacterium (Candidatus Howlettbacteria) CG23_combo_of_CG06-09_8_20_14_all_37_9]PIX98991.1 MAG: hypothetical protein COZ22_03665 [bacterium (Candidatus Howlettbacteria) CG_4_10_14_3_um_filter_37_10]PJB05385.1 MAG: hypothetical protein CO123_04185 [bacterium (Candidatus Howlettbacteria) CG_4_9_14_3_um_filter_37_10]